jgi:hypothetical protein
MDTQAKLKHLQCELNQALNEQQHAEAEAESAQKAYDKALANWEAQNAAIVAKKNRTAQAKADGKKRIETLREEAKALLGECFIEDLPEGFNQKREKVVVYDPQSFLKIARDSFPFLLMLNAAAVQKFFKDVAEEQADGSFLIPENIRSWAQVEIVTKPKPEISEVKLSKLKLEAEPTPAATGVVETVAVNEPWTPPANTTAFLTAPSADDLLLIEDFSPEDESLPINEAINPDLWDEALEEIDATPTIPLSRYGSIPPTEDINF